VNFIFYGLIFVGFGAWKVWRQRREAREGHTHRCTKCGHTWHHAREDWKTVAALAAAHTCPKCGEEQFEIDKIGNISSDDAHAYGAALQTATTPKPAPPTPPLPTKVRDAAGPPKPAEPLPGMTPPKPDGN